MAQATKLPSFNRPPVVEVVLSAQFAEMERMTAAHLGTLWQKFRKDFPETEQQPPLPHQVEAFGQFRPLRDDVTMQLINAFPVPRCWFKDQTGNQLIQVQADRFMHNWRKRLDDDNYPRYPQIRGKFVEELKLFEEFVVEERLGELFYDQCEISYFNHIVPLDTTWESPAVLENIVSFWSNSVGEKLNCDPEDIKSSQRFIISEGNQKIGRLHLELHSGIRLTDKVPLFILNLTARLSPAAPNIESIMERLDSGRIWIIEAFQACSSESMRKAWGEHYEQDN